MYFYALWPRPKHFCPGRRTVPPCRCCGAAARCAAAGCAATGCAAAGCTGAGCAAARCAAGGGGGPHRGPLLWSEDSFKALLPFLMRKVRNDPKGQLPKKMLMSTSRMFGGIPLKRFAICCAAILHTGCVHITSPGCWLLS